MTYAVYCRACDETVWPPAEAEGPGGQSEIAALRLALQHVRETGHTEVRTTAGCYFVGDGERPTAFGDGTTDPDDVRVPDRSKLADATATAARTMRSLADDLDPDVEAGIDSPAYAARHLRDMADAVESHVRRVAENVDADAMDVETVDLAADPDGYWTTATGDSVHPRRCPAVTAPDTRTTFHEGPVPTDAKVCGLCDHSRRYGGGDD